MGTDLSELAATEAFNLELNIKTLGDTGLLVGDVEALYEAATPLLEFPKGPLDSSDHVFAFYVIFHQLMMCRVLLTKSALATLRMYHADSFISLRRAIESCAFSVRISKHPELAKAWASAHEDEKHYHAYRKGFEPRDVFSKNGHSDYDPNLSALKVKADICSKLIHGSVYGMAGHFGAAKDKNSIDGPTNRVDFFDLPSDTFLSTFFFVLKSHILILKMFGQILRQSMTDFAAWEKHHENVEGRIERHLLKWGAEIVSFSNARNAQKQ
jgi:hypothetical protein